MPVEPNWADVAGVVAAFVVSGIGAFTYFYQRAQQQLNGLMEAFKLLNNQYHRAAREDVYNLYREYKTNNDLSIFKNNSVEIVRADFDEIGSLVRSKTIQKKGLLEAYGYNAYICWKSLEDHILQERQRRGFIPYMSNFEWLSNEALRYWQKRGVDLAKSKIYSQKTN